MGKPQASGAFCSWLQNRRREPLIGNQTLTTDVMCGWNCKDFKGICYFGVVFGGFDENTNWEVGLGSRDVLFVVGCFISPFWIDLCLGTCLSCLQEPLFCGKIKEALKSQREKKLQKIRVAEQRNHKIFSVAFRKICTFHNLQKPAEMKTLEMADTNLEAISYKL